MPTLHSITLPNAEKIAEIMAQCGINPDGSAKALPTLEAADADVIEQVDDDGQQG